MNKILVVANWKANLIDVKQWVNDFSVHSSQLTVDNIEVAITPPYTLLQTLSTVNSEPVSAVNQFALASQDLSMFPAGAYTGEIPASMLTNLGVKYVLVGHSERRKYLKETNLEVEAKLQQAIANNITPIICAQSLEEIPNNLRNFDPAKFLIMYEPFSAISTQGQYHPESAENVKSVLMEWQAKLSPGIKFLYGGSVSQENIKTFLPLTEEHILSGFVIGHASLDPNSFYAIISCLCGLPS